MKWPYSPVPLWHYSLSKYWNYMPRDGLSKSFSKVQRFPRNQRWYTCFYYDKMVASKSICQIRYILITYNNLRFESDYKTFSEMFFLFCAEIKEIYVPWISPGNFSLPLMSWQKVWRFPTFLIFLPLPVTLSENWLPLMSFSVFLDSFSFNCQGPYFSWLYSRSR